MSVLKKIENTNASEIRAKKINAGISHAASLLKESNLGNRCPNLLKDIKSESVETKYKAATLTQLLENTAEYYKQNQGADILHEDFGPASTSAVSLLNPGVANLTPQVIDIVNKQ